MKFLNKFISVSLIFLFTFYTVNISLVYAIENSTKLLFPLEMESFESPTSSQGTILQGDQCLSGRKWNTSTNKCEDDIGIGQTTTENPNNSTTSTTQNPNDTTTSTITTTQPSNSTQSTQGQTYSSGSNNGQMEDPWGSYPSQQTGGQSYSQGNGGGRTNSYSSTYSGGNGSSGGGNNYGNYGNYQNGGYQNPQGPQVAPEPEPDKCEAEDEEPDGAGGCKWKETESQAADREMVTIMTMNAAENPNTDGWSGAVRGGTKSFLGEDYTNIGASIAKEMPSKVNADWTGWNKDVWGSGNSGGSNVSGSTSGSSLKSNSYKTQDENLSTAKSNYQAAKTANSGTNHIVTDFDSNFDFTTLETNPIKNNYSEIEEGTAFSNENNFNQAKSEYKNQAIESGDYEAVKTLGGTDLEIKQTYKNRIDRAVYENDYKTVSEIGTSNYAKTNNGNGVGANAVQARAEIKTNIIKSGNTEAYEANKDSLALTPEQKQTVYNNAAANDAAAGNYEKFDWDNSDKLTNGSRDVYKEEAYTNSQLKDTAYTNAFKNAAANGDTKGIDNIDSSYKKTGIHSNSSNIKQQGKWYESDSGTIQGYKDEAAYNNYQDTNLKYKQAQINNEIEQDFLELQEGQNNGGVITQEQETTMRNQYGNEKYDEFKKDYTTEGKNGNGRTLNANAKNDNTKNDNTKKTASSDLTTAENKNDAAYEKMDGWDQTGASLKSGIETAQAFCGGGTGWGAIGVAACAAAGSAVNGGGGKQIAIATGGALVGTYVVAPVISSVLSMDAIGSVTDSVNVVGGWPGEVTASGPSIGGGAIAAVMGGLMAAVNGGGPKEIMIAAANALIQYIIKQVVMMALMFIPVVGPILVGILQIPIIGDFLYSKIFGPLFSQIAVCPLVIIILPDGRTITIPSAFLVGVINKKMERSSYEKLLLTDEQIESMTNNNLNENNENSLINNEELNELNQTSVYRLNRNSIPKVIQENSISLDQPQNIIHNKLQVVLMEVLPEILYLNTLSILDIQFDKNLVGEWFMDQNEKLQFFGLNKGVSWKQDRNITNKIQLDLNIEKIDFEKELDEFINQDIGSNTDYDENLFNKEKITTKDIIGDNLSFNKTEEKEFNLTNLSQKSILSEAALSPGEFKFTIDKSLNEDVKILVTGGITSFYHKEKFKKLAKYSSFLQLFHYISDNTFFGKLVEKEIMEKEGFNLLEKTNGEWKSIHKWVTYSDQPRAIDLDDNFSNKEFKIIFRNKHLSFENIIVSKEINPDYDLYLLKSENLTENLYKIDEKYQQISTGEQFKYDFDIQKLEDRKRQFIMHTHGYYHPLVDYESIEIE